MGEEAQKTTLMILHVDLQCSSCYKKVKKVICKFPQIKDRKFDEKANKVFITVVCCSPEKIRDKLCCKGCGVIKSIEIVEPPTPRAPEKPKPPPEKPKEPEKPKPPPEKPKEPEKPKPPPEKPKEPEKPKPPPEKPKEPEKPKPPPEKPKEKPAPSPEKPKDPPPAPKPIVPASLPQPPKIPEPDPVFVVPCNPCYPAQPPFGFCCGSCAQGIPGGPCYGWYGRPPPPPPPPPRPCYEPFFGCRCGQSRGYYGCRCECNNYYCELDNSSCSIM